MVATEGRFLDDKSVCGQILDHISLAGPVVSAYVLRRVVVMASVVAVGHLGAHYLAAAGLASVTANVTGNSMVIGLSGALTTLCSQANGANNKREMSIILQRAILILSVYICLPVSILWACSESIMVLLGQDEAIAKSTKDYMLILIPGLWALSANQCINMWLYAQAKTKAVATIAFVIAVIHPLWLWLLIYFWNLGFLGSAIALSLSKWVELFALLGYIYGYSNIVQESEFEWSYAAWSEWRPFLRLGMPSLLMMTEWWASEIIIFMSGALSNPEVQMGAMSIYQNLLSLCFMLPAGVREACSTIVGNALGANKPALALNSSRISPALAFFVCGLMSALIIPLRHQLGRIFTDDAAVVSLVSSIAPILAAYVVSDGLQGAYTGVIKGVGKQGIAGPIVVFSYYAVGIPISTYLALDLGGRGLKMGVWGLCVGTLVGTAVHALLFAVVVHGLTDMQHEAALIQEKQSAIKEKAEQLRQEGTGQGMEGADETEHGGVALNPLSGESSHGMLSSERRKARANSASTSGSGVDEPEDGWWEDLTFLGFEHRPPGRTALSRSAPSPGLLAAAAAQMSALWRRTSASSSGVGKNSGAGGAGMSPLQYQRRQRRRRGARIAASSSSGQTSTSSSSSSTKNTEYELVRAHTAALGPRQASAVGGEDDDDSDYMEIDFDFI